MSPERPKFNVIDCPECGRVSAERKFGYLPGGEDYAIEVHVCPACDLALVTGGWCDYGPDGAVISGRERIWPSPPRQLRPPVPAPIIREFGEADRCLSVHAHAAASVMARRVLEGICAELGVSERTLASSLKRLHKEGHIHDELLEWSTAIRSLGNQGAHYSPEQVSKQDAEDALAFVEALAEYVFTFRQRYREFQQRTAEDAS